MSSTYRQNDSAGEISEAPSEAFWDLPIQAVPERLEAALVAAEQAWNLQITLHDHAALLYDDAGNFLLPPPRYRHERDFCDWGREKNTSFDHACMQHCGNNIPALAAKHLRPFVHRCWKGAAEIVVPIIHDGAHVCTLFAGTWQSNSAQTGPAHDGLPAACTDILRACPPWDPAIFAQLSDPLTLLGTGLFSLWSAHARWNGELDRETAIRRCIHLRVHEDLTLGDVAKVISLSESRTGQLIQDIYGHPFSAVVTHERIHRAQTLLKQTARPIRVIAEHVGFHNEYYFNRVFSRVVGTPPGRWRQKNR